MATAAYNNWVANGRPWKLAEPIKAIGDRLKSYGYTVYYLGDNSHLQSNNPQDHTPFSRTGWPAPHPYPWVLAMDIMPPKAGSGLPSLQRLGAQLVADKLAGVLGVACLKYMNWEPDRDWGGRCWQDSFKPNHSRTNSSDRGHIHFSGRSDMVTTAGAAAAYDPVARIRGVAPTTTPTPTLGDDMPILFLVRLAGNATVRLCRDFMDNRVITSEKALTTVQSALKSNSLGSAVWEWPDTPEYRELLGVNIDSIDDPDSAAVSLTDEQLQALGFQIRQGVPSLDQIRGVVDDELDEQSRSGADNDA